METAFSTIAKNALARDSTAEFADFPEPISLNLDNRPRLGGCC